MWKGVRKQCSCDLLPVGGGATTGAGKGFTAGAPGPPCGYPDPEGA